MIYLGLQNERKNPAIFTTGVIVCFPFCLTRFQCTHFIIFILSQRRHTLPFSLHLWNCLNESSNLLGKLRSFSLEKPECFWGAFHGWSPENSQSSFLFVRHSVFLLLFSPGDPSCPRPWPAPRHPPTVLECVRSTSSRPLARSPTGGRRPGPPSLLPFPCPGTGEKVTKSQGSGGGWDLWAQPESHAGLQPLDFHIPQAEARKGSPRVRHRLRTLGTSRKLGKWLNRVILATDSSWTPI